VKKKSPLRLMCILAHPDDETLGFGGTLATYAAEGIETYVLTATRGEYGWFGDPDANPGQDALGRLREAELRAATAALGVTELSLLDYIDGELDAARPAEIIGQIAEQIRRVRPHVVLTFGHDGIYGHPDHIAIGQFAAAAIVAAASGPGAHTVQKLYQRVGSVAFLDAYEAAFGELVMTIDGGERRAPPWPSWAITTRIDATRHWRRVWDAVRCHTTQLPSYERLAALSDEHHERMWGRQEFYRAFTLVNSGRSEQDLFEGLREETRDARNAGAPTHAA
jgi:LmbE family N-acetylglucosaminyl deacetylase